MFSIVGVSGTFLRIKISWMFSFLIMYCVEILILKKQLYRGYFQEFTCNTFLEDI